MIYIFIIIIVICLLYFFTDRLKKKTLNTKMFKIGSGVEGSDFFIAGNFLEENCKNIENQVQNFADGGFNNLLNVNKGKYDFGICQERFLINGYNNLLEFGKLEKLDKVRFISALYFENMNFIVRDFDNSETSGETNEIIIDSFSDIGYNDNIIIGVGESLSSSQNNFEVICGDYGILSIDYNKRDSDTYKEYK